MGPLKNRRSEFRDLLEYLSARVLYAGFTALPPTAAAVFARNVAASLLRWSLIERRRLGRENLALALASSYTEQEREKILRGVFEHIALTATEFFLFPPRPDRRECPIAVSGESERNLAGLRKRGGGVIFVTGHLGNWEVLGATAGASFGFPIQSIARRLDNRHLDRWVERRRKAFGQTVVTKEGSVGELIRTIRRGGNVAYLVDQDAHREGVFVDFFGIPASSTRAPALLSIRTGAPIVPVCAVRERPFCFTLHLSETIYPRTNTPISEEIPRITQQYTSALENWIRRYPDQWLWLHRRWKTRPT
ncbi:MAG TPA: lysophospholipid acyltransferase family protein [Acidobacteriota bacterium]|jgi:KDO2-lipid IV(A) lauroyltransferase